jgi:hypothetical protein
MLLELGYGYILVTEVFAFCSFNIFIGYFAGSRLQYGCPNGLSLLRWLA